MKYLAPAIYTLSVVFLSAVSSCICSGQKRDQTSLNAVLIQALKENNTKAVITFLDQGADANTVDHDPPKAYWEKARDIRRSALHVLVWGGQDGRKGHFPYDNPELAEVLLQHGANPNTPDQNGDTCLHWASGEKLPETLLVLLKHHADPNRTDKEGKTPLMPTAKIGLTVFLGMDIGCARLLIEYGADVNKRDRNGQTALLNTLNGFYYPNSLRYLQFLLEHGAKVSLKDKHGKTVLDYARENKGGFAMLSLHFSFR